MVEQKEKELVNAVTSAHSSFLDWKKKQKTLQLATDLSSSKPDKDKKDKKDDKAVVEFPKECTIPINEVDPLHNSHL